MKATAAPVRVSVYVKFVVPDGLPSLAGAGIPVICTVVAALGVHTVAPGPDVNPEAHAVWAVAPEPATKNPAEAGVHDVWPVRG